MMLWLVLLWCPAAASNWEQEMTPGHISSSGPECTSYNEWRASLTGCESSITLTTNGVTVACTDLTEAAAITTYIRDWTGSGDNGLDQVLSCDGVSWAFGQCGSNPSLEIRAGGDTEICDGACFVSSSEIVMRPCIDNENWGGANGPTCGDRNNLIQPTQTFTISTGTSSQSSQCGGGSDSSEAPATTTGMFTFQAGRCYPQSEASYINTGGSMGSWPVNLVELGSPQECYAYCVDNSGVDTMNGVPILFMGLQLEFLSKKCMCNRPSAKARERGDQHSICAQAKKPRITTTARYLVRDQPGHRWRSKTWTGPG